MQIRISEWSKQLFAQQPVVFGFTACGVLIGWVGFFLLAVQVAQELSYDRHHTKAHRIYRVAYDFFESRGTDKSAALTPPPLARVLSEEFEEVETVTRCRRRDTDIHYGSPVVSAGDRAFAESRFYWADATFFDVFSVHFLAGDPKTALNDPFSVVLSRSVAEKYFGDTDPLGKTLALDRSSEYVVTGVYEDFPSSTHLSADFLASLASSEDSRADYWIKNNYYTYLVLREGASAEALEAKLPMLVEKYFEPDLEKWVGITLADLEAQGNTLGFHLQWVPDIHLSSNLEFEAQANGRAREVYSLMVVALGVLGLTFANLLSLATALVRGGDGGRPIRITAKQGVQGGLVGGLLAFVGAGCVAALLLPGYGRLVAARTDYSLTATPWLLPVILLSTLACGMVVGLAVSRAGRRDGGDPAVGPRAVLGGFQLALAGSVVVLALVVWSQLRFLERKDLGLSRGPTLVLEETDPLGDRFDDFLAALQAHPAVLAVTETSTFPGRQLRGKAHSLSPEPNADFLTLWQVATDEGFAETLGLRMVAGRFLEPGAPDRLTETVINETAVAKLGLDDPIGAHIYELAPGGSLELEIVGVVEDFHYESLRHAIGPVVINLTEFRQRRGRFVLARLDPRQVDQATDHIGTVWAQFFARRAFQGHFYEAELARLNGRDIHFGRVLALLAGLSVVFACWGWIGVLTTRGTPAVRPVDAVVALPLLGLALVGGHSLATHWLEGFAYRAEVRPGLFFVTLALLLLAGLATTLVFARQRRDEESRTAVAEAPLAVTETGR